MVRRLEVVLERHRTVPIVTDEDAPDHLAILSNRDVRVLVVPAGVVGPHLQRDVDGRRIVRHVDGQVVPCTVFRVPGGVVHQYAHPLERGVYGVYVEFPWTVASTNGWGPLGSFGSEPCTYAW